LPRSCRSLSVNVVVGLFPACFLTVPQRSLYLFWSFPSLRIKPLLTRPLAFPLSFAYVPFPRPDFHSPLYPILCFRHFADRSVFPRQPLPIFVAIFSLFLFCLSCEKFLNFSLPLPSECCCEWLEILKFLGFFVRQVPFSVWKSLVTLPRPPPSPRYWLDWYLPQDFFSPFPPLLRCLVFYGSFLLPLADSYHLPHTFVPFPFTKNVPTFVEPCRAPPPSHLRPGFTPIFF